MADMLVEWKSPRPKSTSCMLGCCASGVARHRRWYTDAWDLPGGHVQVGEVPRMALVRELQEGPCIAAEVAGDAFAKMQGVDLRWTSGRSISGPESRPTTPQRSTTPWPG